MGADETRTYSVMAKPVGSACNLSCRYCYYLDREQDAPSRISSALAVMTDDILEEYTKQVLTAHGEKAVVSFAWHGGEPLLAGIGFFKKAVRLQQKYGPGRNIQNTLQTNATLLNDEWCGFFKNNDFLLGVSIDGPREMHEAFRGKCYGKVIAGVDLLKKYGVPFNTLTTVNAMNYDRPLEVYGFLRTITDFMQFLPVVECEASDFEKEEGLRFAEPPGIHSQRIKHPAESFSVPPAGYGDFLYGILEAWTEKDIGKKFVSIFEAAIGNMQGKPSGFCVHDPVCGHSVSVARNGDVYSCDRYCYDGYRLGNLTEMPLEILLQQNKAFGMDKAYGLSEKCFDCEYLKLCFGGCPKDRLPSGVSENHNYLCPGYKRFFSEFTKTAAYSQLDNKTKGDVPCVLLDSV